MSYPNDTIKDLIQSVNSASGTFDFRVRVVSPTADSSGRVKVAEYSEVSDGNSTTTTLSANATFTGTAVDCLAHTNISVAVIASHASAADGLILEFSSDSSNWDTSDVFSIGAASGEIYTAGVSSKYFRVRYINGPTTQTYFRLQTILHPTAPKASSHRLSDLLDDQNDAELVKAVMAGKQENGSYNNVALSNSGSFKVAVTDRPSEVRSRTKVEASVFRQSLSATPTVVYTVTSGKTLYVTAFIISYINNANAIGEWKVRDGSADKFGFVAGEKAVGAAATTSAQSPSLPEPIPFSTSVNAVEVSGDIQVSVWFIGYEE